MHWPEGTRVHAQPENHAIIKGVNEALLSGAVLHTRVYDAALKKIYNTILCSTSSQKAEFRGIKAKEEW